MPFDISQPLFIQWFASTRQGRPAEATLEDGMSRDDFSGHEDQADWDVPRGT